MSENGKETDRKRQQQTKTVTAPEMNVRNRKREVGRESDTQIGMERGDVRAWLLKLWVATHKLVPEHPTWVARMLLAKT